MAKKAQKKAVNLLKDGYTGKLFGSTESSQNRIMIGIPLTGTVRVEWMMARYGQVIPCNWSQVDCIRFIDQDSPLGFAVADARNIIVADCVNGGFEWLFFIDHDVVIPPTTILRWNDMMLKGDVPMFGGLYFTRSAPSEPLIYRGRGNSYYNKWKMGDKVWCDGHGLGNNMIHSSILKVLYDESEEYEVMGQKTRRVFETPARSYFDPETKSWFNSVGTEDLAFCTRIMKENIFRKAGWPKYQRKKYPFLIDTSVFGTHIAPNGVQYPSMGEQLEFVKK